MSDQTTVILVSHSIEQIERMCNRILWLERGCIKAIGGREIIPLYQPDFEGRDS